FITTCCGCGRNCDDYRSARKYTPPLASQFGIQINRKLLILTMQPSTDPSLLRALGTEPRSPLPAAPSLAAPKRNRSRRAVFLGWLRKTHLYVGLWGAVLGLLFGATGILLNHRSIMKIPVEKSVQNTAQLPLPA